MSNCILRKAVEADIEDILKELRLFSKFYSSRHGLYNDDDYSRSVVLGLINEHVFIIAEIDNKVAGFISGMIIRHLYNPNIVTLIENFWWVNPLFRGSRAGSMLLDKYVEVGKKYAHWIIGTIEDASPVDERSFLRRGFKFKEKSFLLENDSEELIDFNQYKQGE